MACEYYYLSDKGLDKCRLDDEKKINSAEIYKYCKGSRFSECKSNMLAKLKPNKLEIKVSKPIE